MTKMTKKEKFAIVRSIVETSNHANAEMLIEFIDHEVELLTRKNASDKKPTAKQVANEAVKVEILAEMEDGKLYTCSDIIKVVPACDGFPTQKVSPLMNQLADSGKVEKIVDKRKTYFKLK